MAIVHELSPDDRYLGKVNLPHLNQTIRNLKNISWNCTKNAGEKTWQDFHCKRIELLLMDENIPKKAMKNNISNVGRKIDDLAYSKP